MAILTRIKAVIFGSSGGTSDFGKIGSQSAGSPEYTKDLDDIQSLSQYLTGLSAITNSGVQPPYMQDINALYYLITSQIAYMMQSGIPEYQTDTNYYNGISLVQVNGDVYLSISGTSGSPNIGNTPASSPSNWRLILSKTGSFSKGVVGEIYALTEKTSIADGDVFLIEDIASTYAKKKILYSTLNKALNLNNLITTEVDMAIADTVISNTTFICNPNTVSPAVNPQPGLMTLTLPVLANTIGKCLTFRFGSAGGIDGGLVRVICNGGTSNINLDGNLIPFLYLYMIGNELTLVNDGVSWNVKNRNIFFKTNYISTYIWGSREFGIVKVNYDTKSSTMLLLIGTTVVESGGNTNKMVVIYDSSPGGSSGYILGYNLSSGTTSGQGVFTNNGTLTFSNGVTALVNQTSGNNKNIQSLIYHGLGLFCGKITMLVNSSNTNIGSYEIIDFIDNYTGGVFGKTKKYIDSNSVGIYSSANGLNFNSAAATGFVLDNDEWFVNIIYEL